MTNIYELFQSDRPLVMGILNVTPDSFSDGGDYEGVEVALKRALEMVEQGVDIIDIGGQSTRPAYTEVAPEVELDRLLPVIQAIRQETAIPLSVDTYFPQVAQAVVQAGVTIINDIKGGDTEGMLDLISHHPQIGYIYMHSRDWQGHSLAEELWNYQREMADKFAALGIDLGRTSFDPGIGWKSYADHLALLADPAAYCDFDQGPVLYGVSRKRTIGQITGHSQAKDRDMASHVAHLLAIQKGVRMVRVHDVQGMVDSLKVWQALGCPTS